MVIGTESNVSQVECEPLPDDLLDNPTEPLIRCHLIPSARLSGDGMLSLELACVCFVTVFCFYIASIDEIYQS